jgi:hypothetical protein
MLTDIRTTLINLASSPTSKEGPSRTSRAAGSIDQTAARTRRLNRMRRHGLTIATLCALALTAAPSAQAIAPSPSRLKALSAEMITGRYGPIAAPTLGDVLVAGGSTTTTFGAGGAITDVDLFDPTKGLDGAFTSLAPTNST